MNDESKGVPVSPFEFSWISSGREAASSSIIPRHLGCLSLSNHERKLGTELTKIYNQDFVCSETQGIKAVGQEAFWR